MKHPSNTVLLICAVGLLIGGFGFSGNYKPPPPEPEVTIYRAKPEQFDIPYGFGLRIEYNLNLHEDEAPYRKAVSVTTQYSPDGITWYTDEAARPIEHKWDNIHGNIECGPTNRNLMSGHTYYFRIILNYKSYNDNYQKQSNIIKATVQDYSELCIEEEIARKFVPVLHRHPDDLQPQFLANVDNVLWSSREVFTVNGSNAIGRKEFLHEYSAFHWQYRWDWDSWGIGQTFVQYKWNIADSERYKVEKPGERPLYYHVYKSGPYYYVQYWYFLTMNDIRDQVSVYDPWHEGDFEHVAIELEKVGDNFVPRRANFYMHYGGRQYPANECWWGSDAANELPQLGYDEKHTHLHVWIARNAHASYNYKEALHKFDTIDGSSFVEDVDFTLGYDELTADQAYFYWDYLANLGEIVKSPDSDGNGLPNAHGWNWFDHVEYVPAWQDFQWVPFRGPLGDFWCTSLGVGKTCTAPPNSPPFGIDWFTFSDNEDECGFGNHSRSLLGIVDVATIQYIDPDTGAVICERKPK